MFPVIAARDYGINFDFQYWFRVTRINAKRRPRPPPRSAPPPLRSQLDATPLVSYSVTAGRDGANTFRCATRVRVGVGVWVCVLCAFALEWVYVQQLTDDFRLRNTRAFATDFDYSQKLARKPHPIIVMCRTRRNR